LNLTAGPVTLTISDFAGGSGGDLLKIGGQLSGTGTYLGTTAYTGTSTQERAYLDGTDLKVDRNGDGTTDLIIKLPNYNAGNGTLTDSDNFLWT
jgi:hypothetical protein